jgi:hypothetical protein
MGIPLNGATEAGDNRFQVLSNGVDLDYFKPIPFEQRDDDSLVVSGKMSYHANVSMVLYLVNRSCPESGQSARQQDLSLSARIRCERLLILGSIPR